MIRGRRTSITDTVSCPLLDTKIRRPSGEATMFHGSDPVRSAPRERARKLERLPFEIRMTVTVPLAAFAVNAKRLDGSTATLCGSSPTRTVAMTSFVSVRMTETVSPPGLTTQTTFPSRDGVMGLDVVAYGSVFRLWEARAVTLSSGSGSAATGGVPRTGDGPDVVPALAMTVVSRPATTIPPPVARRRLMTPCLKDEVVMAEPGRHRRSSQTERPGVNPSLRTSGHDRGMHVAIEPGPLP